MARRGAFGEAWRLYRAHWLKVVRISALAYAGLTFLTLALVAAAAEIGLIFAAYAWIASIYWLQAPLTQLVEDISSGREWRGARGTMDAVYGRLGRITGGSALVALAVLAMMSVFPPFGFYFMVRWALLVPVIAVEDVGMFAAFSRSADIVRRHGWGVFVRMAVSGLVLLVIWIAILALTAAFAATGGPGWVPLIAFTLIALLLLSVTTPVIALTWTMLYYELREQVPPEVATAPRLRGGRTLDRAWDLYTARPGRVIVASLPLAAAITGAQVALAEIQPLLALPATLVGYFWLEGVFAAGLPSFDELTARRWLGDVWGTLRPRVLVLFANGVVIGGVLLLTLPILFGFFLLVRWSVSGASAVVDRSGPIAALGRSWRLVAGEGRRALKVVGLSVLMVVGVLLGVASILAVAGGVLTAVVIVFAANALSAPYVGLAWALMHRTLAALKAEPAPAS